MHVNRTSDAVTIPLLFSAQFFLDHIELQHSTPAKTTTQPDLLVGFQLLQYEIVLFDTARITQREDATDASAACDDDNVKDDDCGIRNSHGSAAAAAIDTPHIILTLEHGKSCLFEALADLLALDLQRACDAPLALLVMQQEHGQARLVAFASVPIELQTELLAADAMPTRVCEWASSSGTWTLHDQANRSVGQATGAFTLSCLGRTLAPHIATAIGLRIGRATANDATTTTAGNDSSESDSVTDGKHEAVSTDSDSNSSSNNKAKEDTPVATALLLSDKPNVERVDTAVQCDDERFVSTTAAASEPLARTDSVQAGSTNRVRVYPAISISAIHDRREEVHPPYARELSSRNTSPRLLGSGRCNSFSETQQRSTRMQVQQPQRLPSTVAAESALFAQSLPPPLFYHKPKAASTKKR